MKCFYCELEVLRNNETDLNNFIVQNIDQINIKEYHIETEEEDKYYHCEPIINAITSRYYSIVDALIKHKTDLNVVDYFNNTPLILAIDTGIVSDRILKIIDNTNDETINIANGKGHSALSLAILYKNTKTTLYLLNRNIDFSIVNPLNTSIYNNFHYEDFIIISNTIRNKKYSRLILLLMKKSNMIIIPKDIIKYIYTYLIDYID